MNKAIFCLALISFASAALYSEDQGLQKSQWEGFKKRFQKIYRTSDEEKDRFKIFLSNLKLADIRNSKEGSAIHGITKFSDLSHVEFKSKFLKSDIKHNDVFPEEVEKGPLVTNRSTLTDTLVDWTNTYTTPVKDQGYCGSCWAFSATEQIESDAMRLLDETLVLSPEQIVQCASTCYGCDGGWTANAFKYVKKIGGLETETFYPYTSYYGTTGTCQKLQRYKQKVTVTSYATLADETSMAAYVQATGPLSVCLDASTWSSYTGGILSVCGTTVDHCVQAVGVLPSSVGGYWKVRNSWGTSWGEAGFIRLAYGSNTCDITSSPYYTVVAKV